jgi:hypothetical protein
MHFDFADKPGMVHEYVSKPFNLENGEYKFKKFVDDIFNYDKNIKQLNILIQKNV